MSWNKNDDQTSRKVLKVAQMKDANYGCKDEGNDDGVSSQSDWWLTDGSEGSGKVKWLILSCLGFWRQTERHLYFYSRFCDW